MPDYDNLFHANIKDLRFDGTLEKQKELVIEELPEFDSFLILGHRPKGHPKGEWFVSSSIRTHEEFVKAILNLMLISPMYGTPILQAVANYLEIMEKDNQTDNNKSNNPT